MYRRSVTSRDDLLASLTAAADYDDDPVELLKSDLSSLQSDDLPVGLPVQVVDTIDERGVRHVAFVCLLIRVDESSIVADIEEHGWRKFWPGSLGVEEYHNLVGAAVEARSRGQGDVDLRDRVNEDNVFGFTVRIKLPWGDLRSAFDWASKVRAEILETAEAVRVGIDDLVATAFKRLEGWGSEPLDSLVDRMRDGTANEKGRALEELATRLFNTVPGFNATGNLFTATEEIDIRIQNTSDDAYWRQESYLLLGECKNWSGKCGKDEFVVFKNKLRNRVGRASCGFLISWNGFTETVSKEMLRGSEGHLLVVPIDGAELRSAVRDGDFAARLKALHDAAVFL